MLMQQTMQQLRSLRLNAMAEALERQGDRAAIEEMSFMDRLAMLVETEVQSRDTRRTQRHLKLAKLKVTACSEDIDYGPGRGIDKRQVSALLSCDWIARNQNLIVTGPTGAGKTWLACAFGHQAIRQGMTVSYRRLPRLMEEIEIGREDGSLPKLRGTLAKSKVLILDDWGVVKLTARQRADLLEVVDDRVGTASLIVTAQIPVNQWHEYLGDPTLADAILDRIVHNAHRIELKGESMRKRKASSAV